MRCERVCVRHVNKKVCYGSLSTLISTMRQSDKNSTSYHSPVTSANLHGKAFNVISIHSTAGGLVWSEYIHIHGIMMIVFMCA